MADAEPSTVATAKNYHEALGLFVEEFAKTEAFVRMLLWHYAQVTPSVGKAVLSGTQIDQTIRLIKRIMLVNDLGEPRKIDLDMIFEQLQSINDVRNNIIHFVPLDGTPGDVRHLTDEIRAVTEKHRRDIRFLSLCSLT